jgi:hypothetical protein
MPTLRDPAGDATVTGRAIVAAMSSPSEARAGATMATADSSHGTPAKPSRVVPSVGAIFA